MTDDQGQPFSETIRRAAYDGSFPRRPMPINVNSWPGGELTPQLELVSAAVDIIAQKVGIHNIMQEAERRLQDARIAQSRENFKDHLYYVEREQNANESNVKKFIKAVLEGSFFVVNGEPLSFKQVSQRACTWHDHPYNPTWLIDELARVYRFRVFGDNEKAGLRTNLCNPCTEYSLVCNDCLQEDRVVRLVAGRVKLVPRSNG